MRITLKKKTGLTFGTTRKSVCFAWVPMVINGTVVWLEPYVRIEIYYKKSYPSPPGAWGPAWKTIARSLYTYEDNRKGPAGV